MVLDLDLYCNETTMQVFPANFAKFLGAPVFTYDVV